MFCLSKISNLPKQTYFALILLTILLTFCLHFCLSKIYFA